MAESKSIRDEDFEEAELRRVAESMYSDDDFPSPTPLWYRVIMFAMIVIGVLWIITFYISQSVYPIPGIGNWNIGIGISFMMVGLIMTTRWR
ncbi:cell division protein CrgA [Rothia sp. SD9660Na]|uniref:cell division protein CrgA n=1 Tax=Rothia sp. SD9660Na TaxID=3047030 RepID=UPI0024BAD19F|nr:cell division protein CrgA [Rothia sp. SD9660Na]WHS50381.1 cell division protein CrgA [Rothia sp. SD9660Na]